MRIIAECAVNWKTMAEAMLMIDKCKELGLFAAKFQIYNEEIIKGSEHFEFLKSIMLDFRKAKKLKQYGDEIGQEVFFTPMFVDSIEPDAVDWCEDLGVNYYKIRFADHDNKELEWKIVETNKPFFMSFYPYGSGGHTFKKMIILNCIPKYPASFEDYFQWGSMGLRGHGHGVSDHTPDMKVFNWIRDSELYKKLIDYEYYWEKHVCLDKNCLEAEWSVTFDELKEVLK